MCHASCMESRFFDPSADSEDVLIAPEEHVGRCHIAEALWSAPGRGESPTLEPDHPMDPGHEALT